MVYKLHCGTFHTIGGEKINEYERDQVFEEESQGWWQSIEDALMNKYTNYCTCGDPKAALIFMASVIRFVEDKREMDTGERETREKELFPVEGSSYFIYYALSELDLLEHGGSVPGWTTEKGIHFMEDVESVYSQDEEES
jgi:hypothetical protein